MRIGKVMTYVWPAIGLAAVAISGWFLYRELSHMALADLEQSFRDIPARHWFFAAAGAILAYVALAGYDRVALMHLERRVPWPFIALTSFTAYALSHNIGASVISGAVVRYRAYGSQGLSAPEIGVLVAFCSLTFVLGIVIVAGVVLTVEPALAVRFGDFLPADAALAAGAALLLLVAIYVIGSLLHFRPLRLGPFRLLYPRPPVVLRQLIVAPLELIGAAAILYFTLPVAGNPGFIAVLGIFIASFSVALLSHAPGGLGVLEVAIFAALPEVPEANLLASLLVFRLFYLIIPLIFALVTVLIFERSQYRRRSRSPETGPPPDAV